MGRGLLLASLLCLSACEALLFYPQATLVRNPAQVGLRYEDVRLDSTGDVSLHGWWLPAEGEAVASVLFLHGNAENISTHLASVYWLPAQGVNVLLLDYRGYGQSTGTPSLAGVVADACSGIDEVLRRAAMQALPAFVLGQSLGASISGHALAHCRQTYPGLAGVILDAGFTRYRDIARETAAGHWLTWALQYPAAWAMPKGYDLLDAMPRLPAVPLLLIHGRQDPVVPYHHAKALL